MPTYNVTDALKIVLLTPGSESAPVYLNSTNYDLLATGGASNLTGASGHVMMQIPKFYYSYTYSGTSHSYRTSLTPFGGSTLHPAFVKSGVEVPYRYIGIYEAAWYDVSLGAYVDGDGTNSAFDTSADKLGSIVGKKPLTNKTRAQFRNAAARVGTGWQLMDFWLYSALKMLYITRYGNLNSQTVLVQGNSRISSFNFATCVSATGKVLSITAPGQSTAGGNAGDYCNLFGIENAWGDIWEFVDGWNINSGVNYISSTPAQFADDTTSSYALYESTNPTTSGLQNTLQQNIGMLPASIGATDVTKVTDYYWYNSGWRAPFIGGAANSGLAAGLCALAAHNASSFARSDIGGRLCF